MLCHQVGRLTDPPDPLAGNPGLSRGAHLRQQHQFVAVGAVFDDRLVVERGGPGTDGMQDACPTRAPAGR